MKVLKWEESKGHFLIDNDKELYELIENISSDELIDLMQKIINNKIIIEEISKEDAGNDVLKQSPNFIIYENIYNCFKKIIDNKEVVEKEIDEEFDKFKKELGK